MSNYYGEGGGLRAVGELTQDQRAELQRIEAATRSPLFWVWNIGHFVSVPVLGYHGYKRNDSVGWALVWGLFGSIAWPVTVPIAFAQGFGKRKVRTNRRRRRTSRSRRTSRRAA